MASLDMPIIKCTVDDSEGLNKNEEREEGESKVIEEHSMASADVSKINNHTEEMGDEEANDVEGRTLPCTNVSQWNIHLIFTNMGLLSSFHIYLMKILR
jgi:hypothetical protein